MIATPSSTTPVIDSSAFLAHWQGHRRLTRRVIAAFPEAELFTLSIGGMRPFATMALELIDMASAGVRGIATSNWPTLADHNKATASTRADLLARWDATTAQIEETWPLIPAPASVNAIRRSASTRASARSSCSTSSTTRFTTAGRAMSTCARWESRRRDSTSASKAYRKQTERVEIPTSIGRFGITFPRGAIGSAIAPRETSAPPETDAVEQRKPVHPVAPGILSRVESRARAQRRDARQHRGRDEDPGLSVREPRA